MPHSPEPHVFVRRACRSCASSTARVARDARVSAESPCEVVGKVARGDGTPGLSPCWWSVEGEDRGAVQLGGAPGRRTRTSSCVVARQRHRPGRRPRPPFVGVGDPDTVPGSRESEARTRGPSWVAARWGGGLRHRPGCSRVGGADPKAIPGRSCRYGAPVHRAVAVGLPDEDISRRSSCHWCRFFGLAMCRAVVCTGTEECSGWDALQHARLVSLGNRPQCVDALENLRGNYCNKKN